MCIISSDILILTWSFLIRFCKPVLVFVLRWSPFAVAGDVHGRRREVLPGRVGFRTRPPSQPWNHLQRPQTWEVSPLWVRHGNFPAGWNCIKKHHHCWVLSREALILRNQMNDAFSKPGYVFLLKALDYCNTSVYIPFIKCQFSIWLPSWRCFGCFPSFSKVHDYTPRKYKQNTVSMSCSCRKSMCWAFLKSALYFQ